MAQFLPFLVGFIFATLIQAYYRTKQREEYENKIDELEEKLVVLDAIKLAQSEVVRIGQMRDQIIRESDAVNIELTNLLKKTLSDQFDILEIAKRNVNEIEALQAELTKIKTKHERLLRFLN